MVDKPLKVTERALFHGIIHSMTDNNFLIEVHGMGGVDFLGGIDYIQLERPENTVMEIGDYVEVTLTNYGKVSSNAQ
jgi:hypothetical protein